jgi:putative membrane protein
MLNLLVRLGISTATVLVAANILPGVHVDHWSTAVVVAVVLGVVNAVIKPVLTLLTLPITLVTLGLFMIVINVAMVLLTDWIVPGLTIDTLLQALLFSLVVAVVGWFLAQLTRPVTS